MQALIHTLPYTSANTTAHEKSKTVGDTIGEDWKKALLKTLGEEKVVVKNETFGNTLNNEKAEAILKMAA